jgi:hypothetical protein
MARFVEMDELVTISEQMEEDIGPVIFVNKFNVNPVDVDEFLKRWAADATVFKQQPGFISAQLHRVLRAAVHSSTMPSGSPLRTSKGL